MSNDECLYNVDFICRRPHFKSNTEAAVSIFNIYSKTLSVTSGVEVNR